MPGVIVNQGPIEPRDIANANLIAAAPDLLEALKRTLVECGFNDPNDTDYESEFAGIVRAAIAKADGAS